MQIHLSDHDLERYYLGLVTSESELAPLEEHLLACAACVERAEEAQSYVDAMRAAGMDLVEAPVPAPPLLAGAQFGK